MSVHRMITRSKANRSAEVDMAAVEPETQSTEVEMANDYQQQDYQQQEYQQQDGGYYPDQPMSNMYVSVPNWYDSQQILCARDMSMLEYYQEALANCPDNIYFYLQHLFDIGCSLWNFQIIQKDLNNNFMLNRNFGDYYDWSFAEQNVINNCIFLRQMGHPLYQ